MKRILSTTALLVAMSAAMSTTAQADGHAAAFGSVTFEQSDFFASDLIGMRVYNVEIEMDADATVGADAEKEWDDIGEINDIIVSKDGEIRAVILGIGGFLGLGERDVTVSMADIKVVREEGDSDDRFLVVTTSKEALENAPEFKRAMDQDMPDETPATTDTDTATTDDAATTAPVTGTETDADTDMDADADTEEAPDTDMEADTDAETDAEVKTD